MVGKKFAAKDFTGAKEDLTKSLQANPKNKIALDLRGQTRVILGDLYGAITDFTVALEFDSTYADALNHRGDANDNAEHGQEGAQSV